MATQTTTLLNQANRTGTIFLGAVDAPSNVLQATLAIVSTQHTDPNETIELVAEESYDGGAIWRFVGTGGPIAGGQTDRRGDPILPSVTLGRDVPYVPRRIRGRIEVVGTVRFGAQATLETE